MAFSSIGYDGTVDEVEFGRLMAYSASSEYGVNYPTAFQISAIAGESLMLKLTSGLAWTAGVVDSTPAETTVVLDPVTSGTRWDLIVVRRNWSPPGGETSIAVVKGGASKQIPDRERARGVLEDQPLWLVRVDQGRSVPSEYVDLRVFARNGGCTANDDLVRSYMNTLGTMIEVNGVLWLRVVDSASLPSWKKVSDLTDSGWVFGARSGTGWTSGGGDYIYSRRQGNLVEVRLRLTRNGPDIPVSSSGDIPNMNVGRISKDHAPTFSVAGFSSGSAGRVATFAVGADRQVLLSAVGSDAPIRRGDTISGSGMFFVD
ncbi:hypothetical protein ACTXI0_04530 [Arthrobacter rhombi]|uniref:hypothetical protein n=1 Tax=Arthrobacter rhombi TaxID=71253 RepID=UPI003FD4C3F4